MIAHFVRHGQTGHNRDGLGLGRADVGLTDLGARQATAVAARLSREPITHIYSSPLGRCRSVAMAIAGERGIAVEYRDELLELDVGETQGMALADMRERHSQFLAQWAGPDGHLVAMPGGERLSDLDDRLAPLLDELRTRPHEAVAVVAHNFVIRVALVRLLGLELPAFRSIVTGVSSISTVRIGEGGRVSVRSINDSCFLNNLEP
jgi:broad specificity phosphatase PhoE